MVTRKTISGAVLLSLVSMIALALFSGSGQGYFDVGVRSRLVVGYQSECLSRVFRDVLSCDGERRSWGQGGEVFVCSARGVQWSMSVGGLDRSAPFVEWKVSQFPGDRWPERAKHRDALYKLARSTRAECSASVQGSIYLSRAGTSDENWPIPE